MTGLSSRPNDRLLARMVACFAELLLSSREDEKRWKNTVEGIHRHGLLTFTIEVERKHLAPEIDPVRLSSDRRYRSKVARELAKPLPPTCQQRVIPLERDRLGEHAYLREMAGILGYRWTQKLQAERADVVWKLALFQLNADSLAECLHKLGRNQSTAEVVSQRVMMDLALEIIDNDPGVQKIFANLNANLDKIEERYTQDVNEKLAIIMADADRKFDALKQKYATKTVSNPV